MDEAVDRDIKAMLSRFSKSAPPASTAPTSLSSSNTLPIPFSLDSSTFATPATLSTVTSTTTSTRNPISSTSSYKSNYRTWVGKPQGNNRSSGGNRPKPLFKQTNSIAGQHRQYGPIFYPPQQTQQLPIPINGNPNIQHQPGLLPNYQPTGHFSFTPSPGPSDPNFAFAQYRRELYPGKRIFGEIEVTHVKNHKTEWAAHLIQKCAEQITNECINI